MKKICIYLLAFLIALAPLFLLSGCSAHNIDRLAYVISIGFESGQKEKLKISFEISTPTNSGSGSTTSNSGSSEKSSNSSIVSVECSSIDDGITKLNSYLRKSVDLSHCNIIVFSEELAVKGLHDYVYTLINNIEISPACNILIAACSIEDFFINSSNSLENYSANYEVLDRHLTGYTEIVTISDFFAITNDSFGEPFAILCQLASNDISLLENKSSTSSSSSSGESSSGNDSSSNSSSSNNSSSPPENTHTLKTVGLAVFRQDKLVGYLSENQTLAHLILTNELQNSIVAIPSPFEEDVDIDIYITPRLDTKVKIDLIDGKPFITVNVFLSAKIASVSNNHEFLNEDNINLLEDSANEYLEKVMLDYFEATAYKYESDIGGLGKYVVSKFLTWDDWNSFDWLNTYKYSSFDVSVETTITSSYLLLDT